MMTEEREYWYDLPDGSSVGVNLSTEGVFERGVPQDMGLFIVEEPTFVDWVVLDSEEEYLPLCDVLVDLSELHSAFRNMYWNEVESLL